MNGPLSGALFYAVVVLSTILDAAIAGAVLFLFRAGARAPAEARGISARRFLASLLALAAAFVLKLPVLTVAGVGAFGIFYGIYLHLAFTLPVLGALVLLAALRGRFDPSVRRVTGGARVLAAASLAFIPLVIDATFIEPFRLQTVTARVSLRGERSGTKELRIGILSDIQTDRVTGYERSAVDRVMALAPDVILMPGDLFQGWPGTFEGEIADFRALLSRLYAPGGVYFVLGDADRREEIRRTIEGTPVKLLVNETVQTTAGDRILSICGVERRCESGASRRAIREFAAAPGAGDIRILLAHSPDAALEPAAGTRVDLVVAGHTHGGQVRIPFFGPLLTLSRVPRAVAAGGLHSLDGRQVYVSRGVGVERRQAPRIRFNCPPDVSVIVLGSP